MMKLYFIGHGGEDFDYAVRDPRDGAVRQELAVPHKTKRLAWTPFKAGPDFLVWAEVPPDFDDRQDWEPSDKGARLDLYVAAAGVEGAEAQVAAFQKSR
ncbi:MAG: hypothetical protein KJ621_07580 [Proteobacteria bacterium]|nr:hypothetical protein [Pseudomonadota bacterium]